MKTYVDQLFLHKYSQFGIGNDGGAWTMSFFFKNEYSYLILVFHKNKLYKKYKNIIFMPKKITFENRTEYKHWKSAIEFKKRIPIKLMKYHLKI